MDNVIQATLFDMGTEAASSVTDNRSVFNDPSFANNKKVAIHRWVPWIAGFSREFVQSALERHLKKKGVVLDPFAGVGTTLVEAVLAGHDAIGFEINPYATLACRTKLNACRYDPDNVEAAIEKFKVFYLQATQTKYMPHSEPPPGFKTRTAFYSPLVLEKVLIIHDFITNCKDDVIQNLFKVAFSSTMVMYSNYSYEPSLGTRAAAGKTNVAVHRFFPVKLRGC
jgi:hypothetical protein